MDTVDPASRRRQRDVRLGSGWFYVVAACTLLNSVIHLTGRFIEFYAGLYVTQVMDTIGRGLSSVEPEGVAETSFFPTLALLFDVVLIVVFVLLGVLAHKNRRWAFVAGIAWYGIDGILFLLARQWIAGAVHAGGLYIIFRGMIASRGTSGFAAGGR